MDEPLTALQAAGLHFTTLVVPNTAECVGGSGATSLEARLCIFMAMQQFGIGIDS